MGKVVLACNRNLGCDRCHSVSGAVVTRQSEANFRMHLAAISSAASKTRAELEKNGAKCGNCKTFAGGKCSLKKKIVREYNYCERWSQK